MTTTQSKRYTLLIFGMETRHDSMNDVKATVNEECEAWGDTEGESAFVTDNVTGEREELWI